MENLYKTELQNLVLKMGFAPPIYSMLEELGPPHDRLFRSQVTVDGNAYPGPGFCTTKKASQQTAAKVAFTALSQEENGAQEGADCLYKNLLQQLALEMDLVVPVYSTHKTGPPHLPRFVSTFHISGESYPGKERNTKRASKLSAAKVAYTALTKDLHPLITISIHPLPSITAAVHVEKLLRRSRRREAPPDPYIYERKSKERKKGKEKRREREKEESADSRRPTGDLRSSVRSIYTEVRINIVKQVFRFR
ncbi:hypothetical protein SSX86_000073 [Deinandra increscens subsp. villosa]|uniref:DRBM domain-containing protein n=1 Tax=Deinandra increscens subsp. villosa TaxID=3103831 RepID=A0AAP0DVW7_9ASTR